MTERIFTYSGKEPSVHSPEQVSKILDLLLEQVKVLQALSVTRVFLPAGTKITEHDLRGESYSPTCGYEFCGSCGTPIWTQLGLPGESYCSGKCMSAAREVSSD